MLKTQSRLLPSAVRRRSFRSNCVPAVSPLHFTFPLAEPLTEAVSYFLPCSHPTAPAKRLRPAPHLKILLGARKKNRANRLFVEITVTKSDILDFLKLPIPKMVWEKIRPFQDEDFVEFVKTAVEK
jgi:hypothetical protein